MGTAFFLLLVIIGLGYIRVLSTQSKPQIITSLENKVLAAITFQPLVKINADVNVRGSLSVTNDINGLAIATDSAGFSLTSNNGKLTVVGDALLNQDLSSSGSPTFSSLNLSSTSNQLVFQSGGPGRTTSLSGTLTWTPTAARTVTLPDSTTTLVGKDTTDTLKNKTLNSSDTNTISGSFTGITGLGTISTGEWQGTKIGLSYGGTGATSASGARTALGAAASGANSDITSLTGLTTALSETQGGTDQTTYTTGDVLYASATGIPSWSSTSSVTGIVNLQEESSAVGSSVSTLNFKGSDFTLSTSNPGTSSAPYISIDYSNSKITRSDQNETITGNWIFSSGNVGIGVSPPGAKLSLNGGAYIWPTTTSIAAPNNGLAVYGNISIGTTSPAYTLDVSGNINATTAFLLNGTSINTGGTLSNVLRMLQMSPQLQLLLTLIGTL